ADANLVVDNQNSGHSNLAYFFPILSSAYWVASSRVVLCGQDSEQDRDASPAVILVRDVHASMVFLDDFFDDGQIQSGTGGLGRHIGFEDACRHLRRKSRAIVGDP